MSTQDYAGTAQRTFSASVAHLLETQYRVLGSRRVLELLARDLQALAEQFYPASEGIPSGWMVFTGTKATGHKAHPGQSAADYELVTLAWPVLLPEDLHTLAALPKGKPGAQARAALLQQRLVRLVEHGVHHPAGPVLLTIADLAAILSVSLTCVGERLIEARRTTGKPLPTKGYYFDQGMHPSHKNEIIALYEAGRDEADIARQMQHAQVSVGHYIRDYERVKLLLTHGTPVERIPQLIGMPPNLVQAYVGLICQYHPNLMPAETNPAPT